MTTLVLTTKERMLMHRNQQIAAEYAALRKAYPGASAARIVRTICASGKFKLGEPAIKKILYATGAIVPTPRKTA